MKALIGALVAASFLSLAAARFGVDYRAKPPSEADRIKTLPDDQRQWLTEFVAAIILPEERKVFLDLTEVGPPDTVSFEAPSAASKGREKSVAGGRLSSLLLTRREGSHFVVR